MACVGGGNGRSLRELPGVMIMCHYLMSCDSSMGETLMHCILSSFYLKGKKKNYKQKPKWCNGINLLYNILVKEMLLYFV